MRAIEFVVPVFLLIWISQVDCMDLCTTHLPSLTTPTPGLHTLPQGIQAVVPAYQITCHGTVTQWSALVMGRRPTTIIFQVWRLQGQGYYQLVGANEGELQKAKFPPEKVTLSVPEQQQIHVQPRDVVGFYVGREGDMRIKYSNSGQDFRVVMYIKDGSTGALSNFFTPDGNSGFARAQLGSPMVEVTVEREDITPSPSPVAVLTNYSSVVSSLPAYTATAYPSPECTCTGAQPPNPSSTPTKRSKGQLGMRVAIIITSSVIVFLLLCIILLVLVILLVVCVKSDRSGRKRRRGTNQRRHLEVSHNSSFTSSLTNSLSIRLRRLRSRYSSVVDHQGSQDEQGLPPGGTQGRLNITAAGGTGETGFEESDYVVMAGGVEVSCSDSRTDLCQEQSVELHGNPCYTPTPSSRQSLPTPEDSVYEDPELLLEPSGEYAMAVIVPYEYEQASYDGSHIYEGIGDKSEEIYAQVK